MVDVGIRDCLLGSWGFRPIYLRGERRWDMLAGKEKKKDANICRTDGTSSAFPYSGLEIYVQLFRSRVKRSTPSTSSSVNLLIVIPSHFPEAVGTIPLSLWGPCKVVAGHIRFIVIILFIAIPLRGFALSLAFRIRLLGGAGTTDRFRTLAGCWWLRVAIGCRSWDSGGRSTVWSLLGIGGTFEGVAHASVVFELLGAMGKDILVNT